MDRTGKHDAIFTTFAAGGIAALVAVPSLASNNLYKWPLVIGGGAAILVGFLGMLWPRLFGSPPSAPTAVHDVTSHNVTSYGQSGGVTAHTIHMEPKPRDFSGADGEPIRKDLQDAARDAFWHVVLLSGVNDANQFALDVRDYMRYNGFKVSDDIGTTMHAPFDGHKIESSEINELLKIYNVVIGMRSR